MDEVFGRNNVDRIVSVDLCDIKVSERSGFDREFPGHGRAVTPAIIATLIKAGYQGMVEPRGLLG